MADITGTENNDVLNGTSGDDTIDGLGGFDTALFTFEAGAGTLTLVADGGDLLVKRDGVDVARISFDGDTVTVTGLGAGAHLGTDTLTNVERLRFAIDGSAAAPLDVDLSHGIVVDGYVAGGTVFVDADEDGALDPGEISTTTDDNGNFTLPGGGPLVMFGGTNIDTGLPNLVTLRAPEGSTVVTPLTTLVAILVEGGATAEDAQDAVAAAFGIDTGVDLMSFDPLAAPPGDPDALAVQQASATIVLLVVAGGRDADGSEANEAAIFAALASAVEAAPGLVDLTDPATVGDILGEALPGVDVDSAVQTIVETATAIGSATSIEEVSNAQADALTSNAAYQPDGDDMLANSTTADVQFNPAVTWLADGFHYVVTWTSIEGASDQEVRGRVFNADGTAFADDFLINTIPAGNQNDAQIAAIPAGGFVVVWVDTTPALGSEIRAQIFDDAGAAVGTEIPVTVSSLTGFQSSPSVAAFADGSFVVTWTEDGGGSGTEVMAQIVNADGTFLAGTQIAVNNSTTLAQEQASVAVLDDGNFVVVWKDGSGAGGDSSSTSIKMRMFLPSGAPAGAETLVNTIVESTQESPVVAALAGGGYVVAWQDWSETGGDASQAAIRAQIFDAGGDPVGSELLVNTSTANQQVSATIAALPDGGFVIGWTDNNATVTDSEIRAQRFNATGGAVGGEFRVNSGTAGIQEFAAAAASPSDGRLVVAWLDSADGSDPALNDIEHRLFTPETLTLGNLVFFDANNNGLFDAGDSGIDGVTVYLRDAADTPLSSTVTSGGGFYQFSGLAEGDYKVQILSSSLPAGRVSVPGGTDPDDDIDDDDNGAVFDAFGVLTQLVTLTIGGEPIDDGDSDPNTNLTVDFGFVAAPAPAIDLDGPGGGTGYGALYTEGGTGVPIVDFDRVITSYNGQITSITITIADFRPGDIITTNGSIFPGENQIFSYDANTGIGLISGEGSIADFEGVLSVLRYRSSSTDPAFDLTDNARAISFVVNDGAANSAPATTIVAIDSVESLTLGNLVYRDVNGSGTFDAGDTGINGVTVQLLDGTGTNLLGSTTTAGGGLYSFAGLSAGDYVVRVVGASLPAGYTGVPGATDPDDNVDNDDNGAPSGGDFVSQAVTLTEGDEPTNDGDSNADTNLSVDFGFVAPVVPPPTVDLNGAGGGVDYDGAFTEDVAGAPIGSAIAVTAPGTPITSATIAITDALAGDQLVLAGALPATITLLSGEGTATLTLTGTGAPADWAAALSLVRYTSSSANPDTFGTDPERIIDVVVNDGVNSSAPATATIAITALNDDPQLANVSGDAVTWSEGDALVLLDAGGNAAVSDVDSANFGGGSLSFGILTGATAQDQIFVSSTGAVSVSGNNVIVGGTTIGTIGSQGPGQPLTIDFNSDAMPANVQQLVGAIAYTNLGGDNPTAGPRSIAYILQDGDGGATGGGVTVTVAAVNDAPVLTTTAGPAAFTETVGPSATIPVRVDNGLTLSDPDDTALVSATVAITGNFRAAEDILSFVNTNATTFGNIQIVSYAGGILALSSAGGTATIAQWQAALREVRYSNSSQEPDEATRIVSFTVNDGDSDSNAGTRAVTVNALNDYPEGTSATLTINEDQIYVFSRADFGYSDVDGDSLAGVSFGQPRPSGGNVYFDGFPIDWDHGLLSSSYPISFIDQGRLTFRPDPDTNGTAIATVTFAVRDDGAGGGGDQSIDPFRDTLTFNIIAVNDQPILSATAQNPAYTEDGAVAADLFGAVTASTVEAGQTFASMTLTVSNVTDGASEILSLDGSDVALTHDNMVTTATNGLTVTVSLSGSTATVTFAGAILSAAQLEALVDSLAFRNSSQSPTDANRAVTITQLIDSGPGSAPDDNLATPNLASTVDVEPVNDAPVNATPASYSVNEDLPVALTGISVSDVDDAGDITVHLGVAHGTLTILTDVSGGITAADITGGGNGTNGITLTATIAQINATLAAANGLTYLGDPNFHGSDQLTVSTFDGISSDPLSFTAEAVSPALTNATSLVNGDVDGDSILDLVYIGGVSHLIGIRLGNGDGTFGATTTLDTGGEPSEVILVDIDADNDLDLVSVNFTEDGDASDGVGVQLNDGSGHFGAYQDIATALPAAYDVSAADIDGDGRVDLIVARRDFGMVSVLLASGPAGSFAAPIDHSATADFLLTQAIVVGDFTGDGRGDIVCMNYGHRITGAPPGTVTMLVNNGDGTFAAPVDLATNLPLPHDAGAADLDGDGDLDLVFTTIAGAEGLTVMLGNGDGTFQAGAYYATNGDAVGVTIGDVNGDGRPDLITGSGTGSIAAVFVGNGDGSFQPRVGLATSSYFAELTTVGDFDGDGDNDIALNRGIGDGQGVFLNLTQNRGDTDVVPITVNAVNDAPSGTNGTQTINEDATFTFTASHFGFSDPVEGNSFAGVRFGAAPAGGKIFFDADGAAGAAPIEVTGFPTITYSAADIAAGKLSFAPTLNLNGAGAASVQFQVVDSGGAANGGADTDPTPNTLTFDITSVNDAPTVSAPTSAIVSYTENADRTPLFAGVTLTDADGPAAFPGGGFTLTLSGGDGQIGLLPSRFGLTGGGGGSFGIFDSVTNKVVGQVTGLNGAVVEVSDLNAFATPAVLNALIRSFGLTVVGDNPTTGDRTVSLVFDDGGNVGSGGSLASNQVTQIVQVIAVNDAPTLVTNSSAVATLHYTENNPATAIAPLGVVSDPDSANFEGGTLTLSFVNYFDADDQLSILNQGGGPGQIGVSGNVVSFGGTQIGTFAGGGAGATPLVISLNAFATAAAATALMHQIAYRTISENPTAHLHRQVSFALDDNDGGASTGTIVPVIEIIAVDDSAIAQPDSFAPNEATILAGNVLSNNGSGADSDVDGPALSVSAVNGSGANVGTQITLLSGALLTLNANGTFSYNPNGVFNEIPGASSGASNLSQTDTFTYTLTSGNTATVTVSISGLDSDDELLGTAGFDILDGGIGNDLINGLAGGDVMVGRTGDDRYIVDSASDQVFESAGQGNDRIYASVDYTLASGQSVEILSTGNDAGTAPIAFGGNELGNIIYGNAGHNILYGKGGDDFIYGLGGDDIYYIDSAGDFVAEAAGGGFDRIFAGADYTLYAGQSIEILSTDNNAGTAAIALGGNELNNIIYGNAGNNILYGKGGNDFMGGQGGNDSYLVDSAGDYVQEYAGGGSDRVFAGADYTLYAGQEIEILSTDDNAGTAAIALGGNELNNIIYGNAGNNILYGQGGNDWLEGLGGDDQYFVDSAGDYVREVAGGGNDRIFAASDYTLYTGQSIDILSTDNNAGTAAIALGGNELDNIIYGNDGNNILYGKEGNDTLLGLGGNDQFWFNTALGATNVDTVYGFVSGTDKLVLFQSVFAGLGSGSLPASAFVIGSAAGDADDRIIYNNATGALLYDADGNGGGAAVQFATLNGAPVITASDFQVI